MEVLRNAVNPVPNYGYAACSPQADYFTWESSPTAAIVQCKTDFTATSTLQSHTMAPSEEAANCGYESFNPPSLDTINTLCIDTTWRFNDRRSCSSVTNCNCNSRALSRTDSPQSPSSYAGTNVLSHHSCNEFGSFSDLSSCQTSPSVYSPNSYNTSPSISCCPSPLPHVHSHEPVSNCSSPLPPILSHEAFSRCSSAQPLSNCSSPLPPVLCHEALSTNYPATPLRGSGLQSDCTEAKTSTVELKEPGYRSHLRNRQPRTDRLCFTSNQLQQLEASFERKKYLSQSERETLSKIVGVTTCQVKTWYQNRRTKWKRSYKIELPST